MISKTSVWDYVWGGVLVLLILVVPVLVGYDITFQWQTTTMDFYLDTPGSSTINSVYPGGQAETIGLNPGDVILTVDDIPFKQWHSPEIGRPHILRIERIGYQERMVVPAVRVIQLNFISLASATIVALIFWESEHCCLCADFGIAKSVCFFSCRKPLPLLFCFLCLLWIPGVHLTGFFLLARPVFV